MFTLQPPECMCTVTYTHNILCSCLELLIKKKALKHISPFYLHFDDCERSGFRKSTKVHLNHSHCWQSTTAKLQLKTSSVVMIHNHFCAVHEMSFKVWPYSRSFMPSSLFFFLSQFLFLSNVHTANYCTINISAKTSCSAYSNGNCLFPLQILFTPS